MQPASSSTDRTTLTAAQKASIYDEARKYVAKNKLSNNEWQAAKTPADKARVEKMLIDREYKKSQAIAEGGGGGIGGGEVDMNNALLKD